MKWFKFDGLPAEFFNVAPHNIETWLEGPSIFKIRGLNQILPPLLISTLLHGNETTGFIALQQLLKKYTDNELGVPRNLIIIIGNPLASAKASRHLETQPDYNRIWAKHGQSENLTEENIMANEILDFVISEKPYAHVDIHNNTGKNPFYCVVSELDANFRKLAFTFGESVILITEPRGAISVAMSDYCPSVVLECGRSGEDLGITKVETYLDLLINIQDLSQLTPEDQIVYKTIARIKVDPETIIDFTGTFDEEVSFSFIKEVENYNFIEIPKDSILCHSNNENQLPLVLDNNNNNISHEFLYNDSNIIKFKKDTIPSMLSTNIQIVLDDCLGYLMEIIEKP